MANECRATAEHTPNDAKHGPLTKYHPNTRRLPGTGPGGEQGHLRKEDGHRRGTKEGQLGDAQAPAPTPAGGSGSGGAGRADADVRGGGSTPCDKEKQPAHRSRAGRMRRGVVFRDHQQDAGSGACTD